MLAGKNVNLRVMEKEDFPLVTEWCNNIEFGGEYLSPLQRSSAGWEKLGESLFETEVFIIEKKDGKKNWFRLAV